MPKIMGVVNATPDSFSDGGQYDGAAHAQKLLEEGADILDIGGESTRPGAVPVDPAEEIKRVLPIMQAHKGQHISIDTRNAATMQAAISAGATMINDVSALRHDPQSVEIAAQSALPVCLMHMQGTPQNMQNRPHYEDIMDDLHAFFEERIDFCLKHGVKEEKIILDPGIGFGKTLAHNLQILRDFYLLKRLGRPILLGVSRKSFIEKICGETAPHDRLPGSLAAMLYNVEHVDIIRVHDVWQTAQALKVFQTI